MQSPELSCPRVPAFWRRRRGGDPVEAALLLNITEAVAALLTQEKEKHMRLVPKSLSVNMTSFIRLRQRTRTTITAMRGKNNKNGNEGDSDGGDTAPLDDRGALDKKGEGIPPGDKGDVLAANQGALYVGCLCGTLQGALRPRQRRPTDCVHQLARP